MHQNLLIYLVLGLFTSFVCPTGFFVYPAADEDGLVLTVGQSYNVSWEGVEEYSLLSLMIAIKDPESSTPIVKSVLILDSNTFPTTYDFDMSPDPFDLNSMFRFEIYNRTDELGFYSSWFAMQEVSPTTTATTETSSTSNLGSTSFPATNASPVSNPAATSPLTWTSPTGQSTTLLSVSMVASSTLIPIPASVTAASTLTSSGILGTTTSLSTQVASKDEMEHRAQRVFSIGLGVGIGLAAIVAFIVWKRCEAIAVFITSWRWRLTRRKVGTEPAYLGTEPANYRVPSGSRVEQEVEDLRFEPAYYQVPSGPRADQEMGDLG